MSIISTLQVAWHKVVVYFDVCSLSEMRELEVDKFPMGTGACFQTLEWATKNHIDDWNYRLFPPEMPLTATPSLKYERDVDDENLSYICLKMRYPVEPYKPQTFIKTCVYLWENLYIGKPVYKQ